MVGRVAGRMDRPDRPVWPFKHMAVSNLDVRLKGKIISGFQSNFSALRRDGLRSVSIDFAAMLLSQRRGEGAVINVVMRHENVADGFAFERCVYGGDMLGRCGAGIDHTDRVASANNEHARARIGERTGIIGDDTGDERA